MFNICLPKRFSVPKPAEEFCPQRALNSNLDRLKMGNGAVYGAAGGVRIFACSDLHVDHQVPGKIFKAFLCVHCAHHFLSD